MSITDNLHENFKASPFGSSIKMNTNMLIL